MKLSLIAALLLLLTACNNSEKKESTALPGAYTMLSQHIKGGKTDTTYTSLKQQKIFTDDYMMYANFNPADSVSAFGIGTYTNNMDTVTENIIYNAADSSNSDKPQSFKLIIEKTAKGYNQVIPEIESRGQKYVLTEEYETTGTATTSPLDGAWKLEKSFYVKGKDTSKNSRTQFKMYQAGHFIWGQTYADSLHKSHTGMGFGKFEISGTNKLKESVTVSSYNQVRGLDFDIALEMNGTDGFTQTITNKDSSKSVEIYKRLKK